LRSSIAFSAYRKKAASQSCAGLLKALENYVVATMNGDAYKRKHFMIICISQTAFLSLCYWRSDSGEEDDVVGILLEDVFGAFLDEARH
jgi:hypothetical protein